MGVGKAVLSSHGHRIFVTFYSGEMAITTVFYIVVLAM